MIVSLVGPPCAGKSTFASRFVTVHPCFKYCPIDTYRAEYDCESAAWSALAKDIRESPDSIVESCGFNWQLEPILQRYFDTDQIHTILFYGDENIFKWRLEKRQAKRVPPFEYEFQDEIASIDWVCGQIENYRLTGEHPFPCLAWHSVIPSDLNTKDSIYTRTKNIIMARRLAIKQTTGERSDYRSESVSSEEGSPEDQG